MGQRPRRPIPYDVESMLAVAVFNQRGHEHTSMAT